MRDIFKATPKINILISFHKSTLRSEILSFKEYIISNRNNLIKQQKEISEHIEKEKKSNPGYEYDISEFYEDQYNHYYDFFPSVAHNSTLISLFSFFEYSYKNICDSLHSITPIKVQVDDLKGNNYLEKSKRFVTLILELQIEDLNKLWNQIKDYQKVRNSIVHNNSNIHLNKQSELDKQPLYHIINNNPNLKLDIKSATFSILNDNYLLEFCDLIEDYLIQVLEKVAAKNNAA